MIPILIFIPSKTGHTHVARARARRTWRAPLNNSRNVLRVGGGMLGIRESTMEDPGVYIAY